MPTLVTTIYDEVARIVTGERDRPARHAPTGNAPAKTPTAGSRSPELRLPTVMHRISTNLVIGES